MRRLSALPTARIKIQRFGQNRQENFPDCRLSADGRGVARWIGGRLLVWRSHTLSQRVWLRQTTRLSEMRMTSSTEVKCGILRTTDDKIWLLLKKASCSGTVPSSTSSSKTQNAARTDNDEVIYHPKVELWHHCLLRGANLGSFVSFVFGTPVLLYKGVRQPSVLLHRLAGISTYGVVSVPQLPAVFVFACKQNAYK